MIRLYRQEGRNRRCFGGYGGSLHLLLAHMEAAAEKEAKATNNSVQRLTVEGCTEFQVGPARFFYWIIGRNQDARGYLKDRRP